MGINQNSMDAFNHIKKNGLLSDKRLKVYQIFVNNPLGLTGSEVSDIFKKNYPSSQHSETIRNRITELRDMGVLDEIGNVDCKFTKRKVMKYRVNTNMPTKLVIKKSLNTNIDEIILDLKKVWDLTATTEIEKRTIIREIKDKLIALKK
jgi:Fe2+ or Zn2+ uptake regulation protein